MIQFLKFLKFFNLYVILFIATVFAFVIPNLIKSHNFLELFILTSIAIFILTLLMVLNRYFFSMAINFNADEIFSYFTYSNGTVISVKHCQVKSVKCYTQRYLFKLSNGRRLYLTRFESTSKFNRLHLQKKIDPVIKKLYTIE